MSEKQKVETTAEQSSVSSAKAREARELKRHLRNLSAAVTAHLRGLDAEMAKPSTHERGQRMGKLAAALDLANDRVRYFALGVDYRKDKK